MSAPIRRRRDGRYAVKLDSTLRSLLENLAGQLSGILGPEEPTTRRLFPPAYTGDDEKTHEAQYRNLVDDALVNHHREALEVLSHTVQADVLTESEVDAWLSAVGSLRLVLGTRLDVSEDMEPPSADDPAATDYAVYEVLGHLQYLLVEALAADLPPEGRSEEIL